MSTINKIYIYIRFTCYCITLVLVIKWVHKITHQSTFTISYYWRLHNVAVFLGKALIEFLVNKANWSNCQNQPSIKLGLILQFSVTPIPLFAVYRNQTCWIILITNNYFFKRLFTIIVHKKNSCTPCVPMLNQCRMLYFSVTLNWLTALGLG